MLTSKRLHVLIWSLAAVSLGLLVWLYYSVPGTISTQICPINRLTGVPCPSCGTARSLILLADGRFATALMTNPLGYLAAALLTGIPLWSLSDLIRGRDTLFTAFRKAEQFLKENRLVAVLLVLLILANWIWNIVKGL
jgi:hypothetical protein